MNGRNALVAATLAAVMAGVFAGLGGCGTATLLNQTKERTGNVTMVFFNNTPYTASFSYGTWDEWDRSPGAVSLQQLRLAPNSSSSATSVTCRRNAAVATQAFYNRVIWTKTDQNTSNFDPEAFDVVIHFSAAPSGSDTQGLPTVGTAQGSEKLLGVDYSCADQLVFKFFQDPDAPGGFRVDFEDILDKPQGQ